MKIFKLAAAAALAVSGLAISVAPAAATQRGDNMEQRDNMRHDGMRGDNDRHDGMRHDDMRGDDMRGDRGRHYGWNHNRGHHYGWRNNRGHRVCRTVWRHHMRQRVCYWR